MAKIIKTHEITPDKLKPDERESVYNGLDCCVTLEVLDALLPQLDNLTSSTYSFSRSLQGPVLEMRLRGVRVDSIRKAQVVDEYYDKLDILERNLERIVREGVGYFGFNWRSNDHLKELFYNKLGIPTIKYQGRPTVNRGALEKLEAYIVARLIVRHLISLRELGSKIKVLKTDIDPDGRYRTSFNIAGTSTFRFSSSFSEFGTGGNLQNVEELLRSIFIADDGMRMAYIDAAQIQSRIVGAIEWNLFKDGVYLDACESGDLHTVVAKMCWPDMPWTGDLATDRELAEQPYYRHYDRRFMCKKIGHGTNFMGKPYTISQQTKIEQSLIEQFQPRYFTAFPRHVDYHDWIKDTIRSVGVITGITGRRRYFMGRRDSEETFREAVAFDPQASESVIVNTGMLNVWRHLPQVQLLLQNHDAIVVQYPEEQEDELIPQILKTLEHPVELLHNRTLLVPYDCATGWNFGKFHKEKNPDGLKGYKPGDKRVRTPVVGLMDRIVRTAHGKS